MLEWLPTRAWLLLLVGFFAWPAVRTVLRRFQLSRYHSEFPAANRFALGIAGTVLAVATSIFIFTPTAEALVRSPRFPAVLLASLLAFTVYMTGRGYLRGELDPLILENHRTYSRVDQPERFWMSLASNVFIIGFLVLGLWVVV